MTVREAGRVWLVGLLVVVLVGALGVGAAAAWSAGHLNSLICGGDCGPEAVATPEPLALAGRPAAAEPQAPGSGVLDPAAVAAAVEPLLDDEALGSRVGAVVLDPRADGEVLLDRGSGAFVPASTTKILTAFAALDLIDPAHRFTTSVVRDGDRVVLVGGGDPYLAATAPRRPTPVDRADLRTLARRTAEALAEQGVDAVSLGHDASLFTGPAVNPAWEASYVPDQVVTPISALWADRGIRDGIRAADPARAAADRFAGFLEDAGIDVRGDSEPTRAPEAPPLAEVEGPTLAQAVEAMLVRSDNEASEVLLHHVAIAAGRPADFEGGTAAVRAALDAAGVPLDGLVLTDGSGLSRRNRVTPATLAHTLAAAVNDPRTARLGSDLPIGGFTGTLTNRFGDGAAGAGVVRAKTGTLTGVHSLAGVATDARGVPVVFALMTDDTEGLNPFETQAALDEVAGALARCRCG